ncbi:hypothetical protein FS837_007456 [Tulasnella sp. UAMH 9824]|nr:hypothetical protein FS837_007456 [Tulasnella sp. UAMH 9824]
MVSVKIQKFTPDDDWQVNLGVVLSKVTENRMIAAIKLKVDRPHLTLSATNFQFTIPSSNEERENTGSGITYRDLFSGLGTPIRTAVTSLHLDGIASQNSTAILMAANEFFPSLAKLSLPAYERLKSRKPWNVILEKVIQSAEEVNGPVCLCRKLTSLEITTYERLLDIPSILQFVRIRAADRKLKGKEVEKSHITSIHITLEDRNLSAQQTVALNELKGVVADVSCVAPFAKFMT